MEIPYDDGRILFKRFKGKRQIDWNDVKQYLEGYVGDYYEIAENAKLVIKVNPQSVNSFTSQSYLSAYSFCNPIATACGAFPIAIVIAMPWTYRHAQSAGRKIEGSRTCFYQKIWFSS